MRRAISPLSRARTKSSQRQPTLLDNQPMKVRVPFGLDAALQTGTVTILCGAGVSAAPPSNLPLASALVASARAAFLGRYDTYIRTFAVRPETFFKYVHDLAQLELIEYLKRILASDKPNSAHPFLA